MTTGQQVKAKGIVDIVFVLDVSGSMQSCIDALKENISTFIDSLTTRDANNSCPVKDWRAKAVGYRDFHHDTPSPFIDNPFVRDAGELKAQLAALKAEGGEDEPESALDALFRIAVMGQTEKGAPEESTKWRYRSAAARVAILFTDASCHPTMSLPEASGAGPHDLINKVNENRIILNIFAPDMPCYDELSKAQRSEYDPIPFDPAEKDGAAKALAAFTKDRENFKRVLKQLAASVSKSAEAETPAI